MIMVLARITALVALATPARADGTPALILTLEVAAHVGGACSLDVDTLWITPLPLPSPSLSVGPLVELSL
jgi:hypothetical protein